MSAPPAAFAGEQDRGCRAAFPQGTASAHTGQDGTSGLQAWLRGRFDSERREVLALLEATQGSILADLRRGMWASDATAMPRCGPSAMQGTPSGGADAAGGSSARPSAPRFQAPTALPPIDLPGAFVQLEPGAVVPEDRPKAAGGQNDIWALHLPSGAERGSQGASKTSSGHHAWGEDSRAGKSVEAAVALVWDEPLTPRREVGSWSQHGAGDQVEPYDHIVPGECATPSPPERSLSGSKERGYIRSQTSLGKTFAIAKAGAKTIDWAAIWADPKSTMSKTQVWDDERRGPKTWYEKFEDVVKGEVFEIAMGLLILLNAAVFALQMQYSGLDLGYELRYGTYWRPAEEAWPGVGDVLDALDKVFVCAFSLELLARLIVYRKSWFFSLWNYGDATIVVLSLIVWASPTLIQVNATVMRLGRLGKLVRLVRVVRSGMALFSLKLLVASLAGSFTTLFWSVCVLLLIQSLAAMLLTQLVEPFLNQESAPLLVKQEVFSYYGTFWRSIITMFEITFANWAPPCRLLVNNVAETFGLFFLVYRCAIGFAVLSVIQAVFIQQTMKSAQADDELVVQAKDAEKDKYVKRLQRVFEHLDESGDGFLTWEEFAPILNDEQMKAAMMTLEVDVKDLRGLFDLLENGSGQISSSDFVKGLQSVKGGAKALDVCALAHSVSALQDKIDTMFGKEVSPRSGPRTKTR